MPDLLGEARLSISALFRCAKLILEKGVILGADNGEIVAHRVAFLISSVSSPFYVPFTCAVGPAINCPFMRSLSWLAQVSCLSYL